MAAHQISAPPCAMPPVPGGVTPPSGVIHIKVRHVAGFTIIGNHLAQHRSLSLVAIGLAAHIQSLPAGAKIGIKVLAERFPESETRIAAALRELDHPRRHPPRPHQRPPHPLKHPAKLLRHRITALLPPPLPGMEELAPAHHRSVIVIPLQNCDRCDRAFRSRHPGHCRDCRTDTQQTAA